MRGPYTFPALPCAMYFSCFASMCVVRVFVCLLGVYIITHLYICVPGKVRGYMNRVYS
jgi:hypothetical protein